jgi:DNA-nicking Smr family endonuclease
MKPRSTRIVHRPFGALGARLPAVPPDGEPKPRPERLPDIPDEAELLSWAMRGVAPLRDGAERLVGRPPAEPQLVDEDAEAYQRLKDLVDGRVEFLLSDSDEFLEGRAEGVDSRVLRKLRSGGFSVQDYVDLHGLTRVEAKEKLTRFVERSAANGRRSVLVVHGRGLRSPDKTPVLKPSVAQWLTRGALARWTLAFCTARRVDGGAGALYVLLRSRPAPKG